MATRHRFQVGPAVRTVALEERGPNVVATIDEGDPVEVDATTSGVPGMISMLIDGRPVSAYVSRRQGGYAVTIGGRTFTLAAPSASKRARGAIGGAEDPPGRVSAPVGGVVVEVRVQQGESITAGQGLVVLEAMKMQNEVQAPLAGTVTKVHCEQGGRVEKGDLLIEYDPAEG